MELAKNWIAVDTRARKVIVGVFVQGKGYVVQPVYEWEGTAAKWLSFLGELCDGEGQDYHPYLDRPIKRCEELLDDLFETLGIDFKIENLRLQNGKHKVFLVGG